MNWWVLRRRIHSSWLVAAASLGVTLGVILAQRFSLNSTAWLCVGIELLILGFWRHKTYALMFVFIAGGIIGLWRGGISQQQLSPYKHLIGYTAEVKGTVQEDPDVGKSGELVLGSDHS